MINISIVIVTYNSEKLITSLLDSISHSKDKLSKEIIVVDNASVDNSVLVTRKHKLKPQMVANKANLGFAKAVNQALKKANGEYVLLLNPDTKVIGNAIGKLYEFAKRTTPTGAVAPRLVDPNGRSQASVFRFPSITNALLRYFLGIKNYYGKYLPSQRLGKVDVAVMAAMLIPKNTIESIGMLDERFFLYYEDIEFCLRLKRAGLPLYYFPEAKIMHVHGASGNFKSHRNSPLLQSAVIFHGRWYFEMLNLVLWSGQKFEKVLQRLRLR